MNIFVISRAKCIISIHQDLRRGIPLRMTGCQADQAWQGQREVRMAAVIAVGVKRTGEREVLGSDVGAATYEFWLNFLRSLVAARPGIRPGGIEHVSATPWKTCWPTWPSRPSIGGGSTSTNLLLVRLNCELVGTATRDLPECGCDHVSTGGSSRGVAERVASVPAVLQPRVPRPRSARTVP